MRTRNEDQLVPPRPALPSRRSVLRAAALGLGGTALGLGGCDAGRSPAPPAPPSSDPLARLLAGATELVGRYDAALAAHPDLRARLTPVREAHLAHATALAGLLGVPAPTAPPTPDTSGTPGEPGSPADRRGTLAALRAAEEAGRRAAADACLAASPARVALLGSITAARATHLEVLR